MPYVNHKMRALIELSPGEAKEMIISAFKKAKCHYAVAAKILGCKQHSVTRWARILGIHEKLEQIEARAEREGWHHGRKGGAGFHKDPEARARKASRTRKLQAKAKEKVAA